MAKAIPDRWLDYKPIGKRVPGTRFIAFKVPLHQHVNAKVKENLRLAPESLLESIPNLGLIIDLTNTNRYYHPSALTNHDVRHQKLMIPGKQTPNKGLAEKFCGFVADFLKSNADNDKLIGVHCTHGVNRTGYLICYFMISVMKKSPAEAIKNFSAARGHKIERENYLSSLAKLSSQGEASSREDDNEGYEFNSRHQSRREYGNYRQQDSHKPRGYHNYNYDQPYGNSYTNSWRYEGPRQHSQNRYYSKDNRFHHQDYQSNFKNSRYQSQNWRDSSRREHDDQDNSWSYSHKFRQDREYRQDRFQDRRSTAYQQSSRGFKQNHYKNNDQRDDWRKTSRNRLKFNDE
ncbi:RNA/RNP complex-1-interacting phosphatase homolog isoform X2 [Drosophila elegans]|uniref:RNA/RNP complex-1-interacting phosphatase homolog isoform X2 n=1 Tax=Drosophila elegans TaxID=30023 RepID=UPI0007E7AD3E|nr:RNA/RNP complex-1-interacting phosphatase homolog isoform X2 [Drosophila elegans]